MRAMAYDWKQVCRDAAEALTQEKRQEFLNHMWAGKTLGEAYELAGISFDAANGIMMMNIESRRHLRRESL